MMTAAGELERLLAVAAVRNAIVLPVGGLRPRGIAGCRGMG